MLRRLLLLLPPALVLAGCALTPGLDALRVQLAGIEPLPGEGLELRLAVKLRVQNPNEQAIDFDGIAVELQLRGQDFASGVSDVRGTVPRFGETVIVVPLTVSAFALARQLYSLGSGDRSKVDYVASGKLGGVGLGAVRFSSRGEFALPAGLGGGAPRP